MQEFLTQVTRLKHLTLDVMEIDVELMAPEELSYQAGQYMEFKVGGVWRAYSFATPPVSDNPNLMFCAKLEPKGVASDFIRQLEVGSELVMRGPSGNFVVADFHQPTFFVATGVGVVPFGAMIPDMLMRGSRQPIRLLFGVRNEEEVFYYDRFNRLSKQYDNFKFVPILSRPRSHWPGETGYVTTYLEISYPYFKDYIFYLCGDKAVVTEAQQILLKAGQDPQKIKLEFFA